MAAARAKSPATSRRSSPISGNWRPARELIADVVPRQIDGAGEPLAPFPDLFVCAVYVAHRRIEDKALPVGRPTGNVAVVFVVKDLLAAGRLRMDAVEPVLSLGLSLDLEGIVDPAVGSPGGVDFALVRGQQELVLVGAVGAHEIQVTPGIVAIGGKGDPGSVRRPGGKIVAVQPGGEPGLNRAIDVHHIDVRREAGRPHEGDLVPQGRPGGPVVVVGSAGQLDDLAGFHLHSVDHGVAVFWRQGRGAIGEVFAIGRPGGRAVVGAGAVRQVYLP